MIKKIDDKIILESLIEKYGRHNIMHYINTMNEHVDNDMICVDSGLNTENLKIYNNVNGYKKYNYFGNCINTVPKIWSATQMAGWLYKCELLVDEQLANKLYGGDRDIPKTLLKLISKYKITDFEHFICGIDDYQKIMFIYSVDNDIHYFFDCIK